MRVNKYWTILFGIILFLPSYWLLSQSEESAKIFEQNNPGVVALVIYGSDKQEIGRGSCLVLSEGLAATAYHLISQAAAVEGFNIKQKKINVEGVISVDKNLDLALLKIKGKVQSLSLGDSDDLSSGKKVFAIGSKLTGDINLGEGTIKNIIELSTSQKVAELNMDIPETFAGGPVLDEKGQTLGMIVVIEKRLKFVVPIKMIQALPRTGEGTAFKKGQAEDYLATLEGAFLAGRIFALTNDFWNAQRYLEKVTRLNPANLEAYSLLASILNKQRNYQAAVDAYNKIMELDPNNTEALASLGQIYLKMQRWNEAIASLEKAVEFNPENKEARFYLGNAYEENRDFAKAAEAYEKYLQLKPQSPWPGYYQLGLCRLQLNQYENAVNAFVEALKGQPQDFKTNYKLAEAYEKAQKYEKAEEVYNVLIQQYPADAGSYYSMILSMYDRAGMSAKAIEAAKKLVGLNPKSEMAVYNLGILYFKLEKYPEAIEAFRQSLTIKPDSDLAYYQIGRSYSVMKKYTESLEAFKKYAELMPNSPDGWFNIAVNCMYLKDFDAALEPMKKCVELQADYAGGVGYYNLGVIYLNLRDRYSALEVYKNLTTISPDLAKKLRALIK